MSIAALVTRRRLALLSGYTAVQVLVQGIAFASGLVLVRLMDQTEYGHYTLAVGMVGLANVLLDLGLSTAVLASGGPLHSDRIRLGSLLADAFGIQRLLLLGGLLLVPIFCAMFVKQGLGPGNIAALVALVLACTALNIHNSVALSFVRLRGDVSIQQKLDFGINTGKLLLVLGAAGLYLNAQVAVLLNLLAAGAIFWVLRRYLNDHVGTVSGPTGEHRGELLSFIRRQTPNTLYYCFIGQITVWLIGLLGNADRVAEVGALGRLAAVFTVIGAAMGAIVQPYFARRSEPRELISGFIVLNAFFVALTATLVGLAVLAPQALLWILGSRYSGLTAEVVWMVLAASLGAWSGSVYGVGASRGWLVPSVQMIPAGLAAIAVSAWVLDLSTVSGCFMMNCAVSLSGLVLTFATVARKLFAGTRRIEATV